MEQKMNQIYSESYNFVYLRAKSMLKREEDIQQLMREVYLKLSDAPAMMEGDQLYSWLAKQTYVGGAAHYRKKKLREAKSLEIDEQDLNANAECDLEEAAEVIASHLEDLPDMYHATLYAFYYDAFSIDAIAKMMDCPEGVIVDRLNYAQKYMSRVLEDYHDDTKIKVEFSAEAMRGALRKWSLDYRMGEAIAQSVYYDICRKAGISSSSIAVDENNLAGAERTAHSYEEKDWEFVLDQIDEFCNKKIANKKMLEMIAKIAGLVVILVVLALLAFSIKDKPKREPQETVTNQIPENEPSDVTPEPETPVEPQEPSEPEEPQESEYILPDSATRELTRADLEGMTLEQLNLARNEIFARHGVIFGKQSVNDYFAQKSWYEPKMTLDEFNENGSMSSIEQKNISLIVSVEDELYE